MLNAIAIQELPRYSGILMTAPSLAASCATLAAAPVTLALGPARHSLPSQVYPLGQHPPPAWLPQRNQPVAQDSPWTPASFAAVAVTTAVGAFTMVMPSEITAVEDTCGGQEVEPQSRPI